MSTDQIQNVGENNSTNTKKNIEFEDDENIPDVEVLQPTIAQSKYAFNLECDEILQRLGGFGCWQWLNFAVLCLPSIASGLILLTYSFTGKMRSTVFEYRHYT